MSDSNRSATRGGPSRRIKKAAPEIERGRLSILGVYRLAPVAPTPIDRQAAK